MTPIILGYFLILFSGQTKIELVSTQPLTLSQCQAAGAEWMASSPSHQYECKPIINRGTAPITAATPHSTGELSHGKK